MDQCEKENICEPDVPINDGKKQKQKGLQGNGVFDIIKTNERKKNKTQQF